MPAAVCTTWVTNVPESKPVPVVKVDEMVARTVPVGALAKMPGETGPSPGVRTTAETGVPSRATIARAPHRAESRKIAHRIVNFLFGGKTSRIFKL